jgi:transposase-like protein
MRVKKGHTEREGVLEHLNDDLKTELLQPILSEQRAQQIRDILEGDNPHSDCPNGGWGWNRSKYKKEICQYVPDLYAEGQSNVEVICAIGISSSTFHKWQKEHQEFREAVEIGHAKSAAWWEKLGRLGASADAPIKSDVWKFNMVNRHKWGERVDVTAHPALEVIKEVKDTIEHVVKSDDVQDY